MFKIFFTVFTLFVTVVVLAGDEKKSTRDEIKTLMTTDMNNFCNEVAFSLTEERLNSNSDKFKEFPLKKYQDIAQKSEPWGLSLVPSAEIRKIIFDVPYGHYHMYAKEEVWYQNQSDLREILEKKKEGKITTKTPEFSLPLVLSDKSVAQQDEIQKVSDQVTMLAVCSMVSVTQALACTQGLKVIKETMQPYKSTIQITGISIYAKVLTEKLFIEGARLAALKILDRFEKDEVAADNSLFEDVFASYTAAGLAKEPAENATWTIMGLIGTGGANTNLRLRQFGSEKEFEILKYALLAITYATPYLDFITAANGRPYSLPLGIKTKCEIGKPYHFWLTAYLAHQLTTEEKLDSRAAAISSYLAQKGYEIASKQGTRSPTKIFTVDSFHYWPNMIRIDVAYAAAGAVFGAAAANGKKVGLDIDFGLNTLVDQAEDLKPLWSGDADKLFQGTGMDAYFRWQKIISPESAFNLYYKEL